MCVACCVCITLLYLQVYQQSQSNKKSIHKTIKDGCKSLQFYGNSYRMIPEGLHPQVCHLHMHVSEETTPKKGTKSTAGHSKGKQQSRLSFGLYQGHVPGTLKDAELLIWKQRYALSDRENLNMQQAVAACVNPQKLLSLQEQSKVVDDNEHCDAAECSSTTTGSQLSLDRWVEWQRASVSTGHVGHSTTTHQLVSVLQFTENVTVTPDFIMSYNTEMQMFLNHDDVLLSSSRQRNEAEAISSSSMPTSESNRKGKRRLCFDSEDEDFVSNSINKKQTTMIRPSVAKNSKSSSMDVSISNNMVDSTSVDNEGVAGNEGVADSPLHAPDSSSVIPPPPNIDSLSWMDQLPLSQSPNRTVTSAPLPLNYSTPVKTPLKTATKFHSPNKDKTSPKLPHHITTVGTASKSVSVSSSKPLSPKQCTPASPKGNMPKLVATVRPSSQSSQNSEKIVTPLKQTKLTKSPKQVSLVGTPSFMKHFEGNQATNQPNLSTNEVKQTMSSKQKKQLPSKSSLQLKKKHGGTLVAQANLTTPTKTSIIKPTTPMGRHAFASKSPSIGSPMCVAESPGRFDDAIDTIPESDIECEGTPTASGGSDSRVMNNKTEEDSFAVLHNKKKNIHQPSFLCTQIPPATSSARTKRKVVDLSDDDFTPVKKKRKFDKRLSTNSTQEEDYLDLEAEVSSSDVTMTEDNVQEQTDAYDVDDSFINDATQLTQLPSKSPVNMQAIYKQSLISPNNAMFADKQVGQGAKYRMQISRSHKLLHHFTGRAGIKILPTDQSSSGIANESLTGSEAEEEYLPLSQDDDVIPDDYIIPDDVIDDEFMHDDVTDVTPMKPSNRRAVIMSPESVPSPTSSHHQTMSDVAPKRTLFSAQKKPPMATSDSSSHNKHIVVSPSLIVSCNKLFFHVHKLKFYYPLNHHMAKILAMNFCSLVWQSGRFQQNTNFTDCSCLYMKYSH